MSTTLALLILSLILAGSTVLFVARKRASRADFPAELTEYPESRRGLFPPPVGCIDHRERARLGCRACGEALARRLRALAPSHPSAEEVRPFEFGRSKFRWPCPKCGARVPLNRKGWMPPHGNCGGFRDYNDRRARAKGIPAPQKWSGSRVSPKGASNAVRRVPSVNSTSRDGSLSLVRSGRLRPSRLLASLLLRAPVFAVVALSRAWRAARLARLRFDREHARGEAALFEVPGTGAEDWNRASGRDGGRAPSLSPRGPSRSRFTAGSSRLATVTS